MLSRRRGTILLTVIAALVGLSGLAGPGAAAAATHHRSTPAVTAADFSGTVKLSNCSGSIVRWNSSVATDQALMLTNGHCYKLMGAHQFFLDIPSVRSVTLLKADGSNAGTVQTTRLLYSTMDGTDVSLYQLGVTYQTLSTTYGVPALTIANTFPAGHQPISVVSGYWKTIYTCSLNSFAYLLHEDVWTWQRSLRYSNGGCQVIPGTSGSPVLASNGTIIGVNNTINEQGQRCTLNNPCEEDAQGNITVHQGRGYAQQTYLFYSCLSPTRQIDLTRPGCKLNGAG